MADKRTVTMYHPEATEPIEALPSSVETLERSGWSKEKPKPPEKEPPVKSRKKSTKPKGFLSKEN